MDWPRGFPMCSSSSSVRKPMRTSSRLCRPRLPRLSPPSRRNRRVIFAVIDPNDPPQQGVLASRIVESAAGLLGTKLVLLVAGRTAEALGVDAAFEATLVARKLGLPAE